MIKRVTCLDPEDEIVYSLSFILLVTIYLTIKENTSTHLHTTKIQSEDPNKDTINNIIFSTKLVTMAWLG